LALPAVVIRVGLDFDTFLGWVGAAFAPAWTLFLAAVLAGRDSAFNETVLVLSPLFGLRTVARSTGKDEEFRFARVGEAALLFDLTVREVRFEIALSPARFFTGIFPNV
jgi:hypothetical protein